MDFWTPSITVVTILQDGAILAALLLAGSWAARRIGWIRIYLIPGSLIAGFIGLFLGPEVVSLVPVSVERMGMYVYHLLALTFIGVGLQSSSRKIHYAVVNLGFMQVSVMLLQGMLGLGIALVASLLLAGDLNPATGMMLPLGFAMGPGIAYSIGNSWAEYGFTEAASIGLSIAAMGFLVAYISGVIIAGRHLNKDRSVPEYLSVQKPGPRTVASEKGNSSIQPAILSHAIHVVLIAIVYALTYALASGLAWILAENSLEKEIPIVWSFHFIIANLTALGLKRILVFIGGGALVKRDLMRRTTTALADYLIVASIAAISLQVAWTYAGPVLLMCVFGAWLTYQFLIRTTHKVFSEYRFERFIAMYAQMTGTISSGLALLRVTDPDYKSPVAEDLVLSSGLALAFGFPLLVLINLPFTVFSESTRGYVVILLIMLVYLAAICFFWVRFVKRSRHTESL